MIPEDEIDEGRSVATKQLKAALQPSAKVRQEHEDSNHAVYREWCPVCVVSWIDVSYFVCYHLKYF